MQRDINEKQGRYKSVEKIQRKDLRFFRWSQKPELGPITVAMAAREAADVNSY